MNKDVLGCVYVIKCCANNRAYYGQTCDMKRRMWEHLNLLRKNTHSNKYLQQDYNIYGENSFIFEVLEDKLTLSERIERETYFIQKSGGIESYSVYNFQDNITENTEMRKHVSENQIGKIIKPESIAKMRASKKGKHLTEEHKLKIKASCHKFIGEDNPAKRPEVRRKISEKVSGDKNGMYGKHHTLEACEKIRKSRLGKPPGNKGKQLSLELRIKISNSQKGRIPWNKGKCRYSKEFIDLLRQEYIELGSYRAVQRLHPEICYDVIQSLIKNGNTIKK